MHTYLVRLLPLVACSLIPLLGGCGPLIDEPDPVLERRQALDPEAESLVLHLPFSEPDGSRAADRSGRGNDGRVLGAQRVRDSMGRSLRFDGEDDLVKVNESESLNLRHAMTLSAWVKTTDPVSGSPPTQREILFRSGANIVFGFEKEAVEGKTWLRCYLRESRSPLVYREVAANDTSGWIRNGEWHHLAVVFVPDDSIRLYIDGEEYTRRATHMSSILLEENNFYTIGARQTSRGEIDRALRGQIDDVRIFNRALGSRTIEALYNGRARD